VVEEDEAMRRNLRAAAAVGLAACWVGLLVAAPVWAAGENERCEGTVVDDQGNPLAGVTITFKELQRNRDAQPVKTSKRGKYAHNVLEVSPHWEIRAVLEGHKIVQITALTTTGSGERVTNDTYMVGSDQGLHKVNIVPQSRSDATSKGRCVIDFVMAPDDRYNEAYNRLKQEKLAKEGKAAEPAAGEAAPPAAAAPAAPAPAAPARDPVDACRNAYASRDYATAVEPCRKAVADKADSAEAQLYLGASLLHADNVPEAEPFLKKALELDSSLTGVNFEMAMLYVKKGRLMQAIPHMEKELEANPQSESILQNLAKLYADTQQVDKAAAAYEQLITLAPDKLENYGLLADAYKQSGATDKEMEVYKRMGEQDPSGRAFYNLGNIMFNKNEMDKAADAYRKAIEQAPEHADAHYQLGMSLVNLGKFKEAVSELDTFVKLKPKDPRAAEAKGMATELRKMGG
jgi:tetratricopeptide (TPR) repeat protein